MEKNLKKTPLNKEHWGLEAHLGEYAGFEMPLWYKSIKEEVLAVRTRAGLFDVSHMGKFLIWGPDAGRFLQRMATRNILSFKNSRAYYALICKDNGGILDDVIIYKISSFAFFLVSNSSNSEKLFNWLLASKDSLNVHIFDETSGMALIALQGPEAENILRNLEGLSIEDIPEKSSDFSYNIICLGIPISISRTGYSGEDGFEIFVPNLLDWPLNLWRKILEADEKNVTPCGLASRDILRLEAGLPLYGNEIDETISPIEAGLKRFVSFRKKGNFIGKLALKHQKRQRPRKKLIGFELLSRRIARNSCRIFKNNEICGWVTSGAFSPTLRKSIGIGYVASEFAAPENEIEIDIRGTKHPAKIVPLPFYRAS